MQQRQYQPNRYTQAEELVSRVRTRSDAVRSALSADHNLKVVMVVSALASGLAGINNAAGKVKALGHVTSDSVT
jgi:hypothetical protein